MSTNIFAKPLLDPSPVLTRPLMLGETRLIASNDEKTSKIEHVTLPPAALPSLSMATSAMDPSHGAAPPHESCAGARGRGSCSRSPCFGRQKGTHRKIERWAGPRP